MIVITTRKAPAFNNYRGWYMGEQHAQGKSHLPKDFDVHHRIPQDYMNPDRTLGQR